MKHKKVWITVVIFLVVIGAVGTLCSISRRGKESGETPKQETDDTDKDIVFSDGMQGGSGEESQTDWNDTEDGTKEDDTKKDDTKKDDTKKDDAKVTDKKEQDGNASGENDSRSEQQEEKSQPEPNNETGWGAIH